MKFFEPGRKGTCQGHVTAGTGAQRQEQPRCSSNCCPGGSAWVEWRVLASAQPCAHSPGGVPGGVLQHCVLDDRPAS